MVLIFRINLTQRRVIEVRLVDRLMRMVRALLGGSESILRKKSRMVGEIGESWHLLILYV